MTIEVDITHKCNLSCRHCNRLCNAEKQYGISRTVLDMDMRHIQYLKSEILRLPKGSINHIRIIGGEPLLSNIIIPSTQLFKTLLDEGFIKSISIVTNGTIPVPELCKPYIVYAPKKVGDLIKEKGILSPKDVYLIKNFKHRNITLSPLDFNLGYKICNRVEECGVHYSVYGFAYTAPCFPSLMITKRNHQYFVRHLPVNILDLISGNFEKDVCSICNFAIENYNKMVELNPQIQSVKYIGEEWKFFININKYSYTEPDTTWINNINI